MHRIVTPTYISCTNSLLWFKRLMRLICTIEAQLKHRRVAVYTHQAAARETIHSHTPMPKTPVGGEDLWTTRDCLSLRLGGDYFWSQQVEKSDKAFLSPSHYQGIHHSRHHHTHVSAQQEGRPRYKTLTRLAWKEEERAVREIVFYNSCFEKVVYELNPWEGYRYLYPIYKPTPCFKLVKLEDLCALSPPSSLAGLLDLGLLQLLQRWWLCAATLPCASGSLWCTLADSCCCCFLHSWALSAFPSMPSGPVLPGSSLVLPCPVVLSCLAPLWSSPCPSASLLALVLWSSSNN